MMFHNKSGVGDAADDLDTVAAYPTLLPGQTYDSSSNTIYDPVTGDTINASSGAIVSGPVLGSSGVVYMGGPTSGNASTGFNWGSIFAPLSNLAANVLGTRYAVPQLNAGQTIQTGPGGTLITQQPAGVPATGGLLTGSTGISTTTLVMLGGVVMVVLLISKKGR